MQAAAFFVRKNRKKISKSDKKSNPFCILQKSAKKSAEKKSVVRMMLCMETGF